MSIKATLSSDGLEEFYTAPTLKEMCLYKCLKNKDILTTEVEVDEDMDGSEKLDWEKFRLKEPIQKDLMEALLDAGEKFLFMLTPNYESVLAAIRMSQPEHLVKVHVNNTHTLEDHQLKWLISGGNVKSLDINGCFSLGKNSLDAINKFGSKLEYLRIGNCEVLPNPFQWKENSAILRTPNLKTFIVSEIDCDFESVNPTNYWKFLLHDFIGNLEELQMSMMEFLETLEFLEPARNKLSSLTLRNCGVVQNANAWASLFKLDKLRFLDVIGSSIGKAFAGENVVQRLLTAMPNLTGLAIDPGLVKYISVDTSIRGQRSLPKRLEFLGIMDHLVDVTEIEKAKLLANDVAYFGEEEQDEGLLRMLEYYSNRLSSGLIDSTLEGLLGYFNVLAETPSYKTMAIIGLLVKTIKNNSVSVVNPDSLFPIFKTLLTADVASKLGEVLMDQCVGAMFASMLKWCGKKDAQSEPKIMNDVIDIMMNLDAKLSIDHYATVVPPVMLMAEIAMTKSVLHDIGMQKFKDLLKKIAQLLKKAVDRFPEETDALWGISSVLVVLKELKQVMVSHESDRIDLIEIFCSLITSLRRLCLNSGPRRTAFLSADGVDIVMELLTEIIDGCLELADCAGFALLEILKSTMEDTELELDPSESGTIASDLEKLLLSVYSRWEFRKSFSPARETTHYFQMESIASLLSFLESDPRHDYKASAAVKKIMKKFI